MPLWIGQIQVAFLLIRANGDPDPYVPPPPDSEWKRQVYEKVFSNSAAAGHDFRSCIRKASYGKADLVGEVHGPFNVDVQSNRAWMLADAAVQAYNQGFIRGVKYACGIFTAPGDGHTGTAQLPAQTLLVHAT
jgi:hypothetical protein